MEICKNNLIFTCRDNTPTVMLVEWILAADLFSGDPLAGLVPTVFADSVR